jgi:cytochrome c peroxidase
MPRLSLLLVVLVAACAADSDPAAPDASPPDEAPDADPVAAALDLPDVPFDYTDTLPAHFQSEFVRLLDNTPGDNGITDDGATLGRVLFYDTALSASDTVSCASCHAQAAAFTDTARLSTGFDGGLTGRNSMPIMEARFYGNGRFFWDERAATLEEQVLMPIQNEVEMGLTLEEAVARVADRPYYATLFERAFGSPDVTSERIALALAQFVRSIVSYRSRYDVELAAAGDVALPFAGYTAEENQGKALFLGRGVCAACHLEAGPPPPPGQPAPPRANQAVFLMDIAANNGLDSTTNVDDNGKGEVTGITAELGRFKSPSLRNVALTGPYMHDGRFATLDQVVRHYSTGVQPHPNLDPRLRVPGTGAPRRLDLTDAEIAALIAFLATLTDEALLADERFSDPFR